MRVLTGNASCIRQMHVNVLNVASTVLRMCSSTDIACRADQEFIRQACLMVLLPGRLQIHGLLLCAICNA